MKSIKTISVALNDNGEREVTIVGVFDRTEDIEGNDVAVLAQIMEEANANTWPSAADNVEADPEPEKPKRSRRSKKAEEPEPEEEAEEKPKRRRRSAKAEEPAEEAEPEAEEKPKRRRRTAKAEEPEPEADAEPEEKPKRRRRSKKAEPEEETGPSKEDVAAAASSAAEELGPKLAGDIIADYSDSDDLDDIPVEKRQAFIDDVNHELEAE